MTTIKGDLILESDTVYTEPLIVEGSILGKDGARYNLAAEGDITAKDINANNICARNIDVLDINAWNIDAWNINAWNIDALFILCEALHQKEGSKLVAALIVENRGKYKKHEMKVD